MRKNKQPSESGSGDELDEKRMVTSGAWERGYHSPSPADLDDIKKDHATHTAPGSLSADEAIREVSGTAEAPQGELVPPADTDSSSTKLDAA